MFYEKTLAGINLAFVKAPAIAPKILARPVSGFCEEVHPEMVPIGSSEKKVDGLVATAFNAAQEEIHLLVPELSVEQPLLEFDVVFGAPYATT